MKTRLALLAGLVAILALAPVTERHLNPYLLQIAILCGINIILAVGLNLINGFTGQFSIGHAGFMAVGGYVAAAFTYYVGRGWVAAQAGAIPAPWLEAGCLLVGLLLGGLAAALAGLVVGLPSLRLRGDYLAIVTLGFGEIIRVVFLNIDAVGAARGFAGIPGWSNLTWILIWVGITIAVAWNLTHSTHGRAFISVREDEVAAEALGIDTTRYKVIAFVIGAFFAGVAGGLFAHHLAYLHTNSFTFVKSIEIVIMVVLGGMGSITGSVVAAIVLTMLPEALRPVKDYRMVLYSLLLILLMIARPQGLFGTRELDLGRFFRGRRRAPGAAG